MSDVTDTIKTLAEGYGDWFLETNPTEAHLLGHLPTTGRFEDVSRTAEDRDIATMRDFASRAEALDLATARLP